MPANEAIVITGLGLVSALGVGAQETWDSFVSGSSNFVLEEVSQPSPKSARVPRTVARRFARVRGFSPKNHIQASILRRMDWCSRMVVAAARQAFDGAGLLPLSSEVAQGAALVVGSTYGNQRETESFLARIFKQGLASGQPIVFPNLVLNAPAAYAALELGLEGPNWTVSEHEISGEAAIATGVEMIQSGIAPVACVGGVDELSSLYLEALEHRRLLATEPTPGRPTRFRYLTPGEGAAMLLLERRDHAIRRGATPLAEISLARTAASATRPGRFPADLESTAKRILALASPLPPCRATEQPSSNEEALSLPGQETDAPDTLLGCSDGSLLREQLDRLVLDALSARRRSGVHYCPFRRLTGEFGAAGALGTALAALALHHRAFPVIAPTPLAPPASTTPERILQIGSSRGGGIATIVLQRCL